ncbi:type III-A CRISPR-associated RAMP protein Csm3 [Candidatus Cloacimonadota bacterium]
MISTFKINGKILLLSGLHIGGNDSGVKIGGIDTPVIKNPLSGLPYIPGSSMKGKIRFLLEHYYRVVPTTGEVSKAMHDGQKNPVAIVFGHLEHDRLEFTSYPTRVIMRDSNIIGALETLDNLDTEYINAHTISVQEAKQKMNSLFVEGKTEVSIDRNTGTVKTRGGGLRQVERVPAGTIFDLEIILRAFEENEDVAHLEIIKKGLKLLENGALGGYGSRGSGRINLFNLKIGDEPFENSDVTL